MERLNCSSRLWARAWVNTVSLSDSGGRCVSGSLCWELRIICVQLFVEGHMMPPVYSGGNSPISARPRLGAERPHFSRHLSSAMPPKSRGQTRSDSGSAKNNKTADKFSFLNVVLAAKDSEESATHLFTNNRPAKMPNRQSATRPISRVPFAGMPTLPKSFHPSAPRIFQSGMPRLLQRIIWHRLSPGCSFHRGSLTQVAIQASFCQPRASITHAAASSAWPTTRL